MLKYAFQGYDATGSSCTFPRGVSISRSGCLWHCRAHFDSYRAYTNNPIHHYPDNDAPLDTMISVTAHELIETMTDPLGDGWLDPSGKEVMDKCAWNYGQTTTILTGAKFTLAIGSQRYMVQTMWDNERLMCVNSG